MPWLPPERDTSGGGMKKTSEKKSKEIIKLSMPPVRDTSGGGGLKKKSEAKSKEIIEVSQPEGDTSSGGGHGGGAGGMKKNGIVKKSKKIINVCFWLKLASMVASDMLYIARVEMLNSDRLRMMNMSEAIAEVDKVKVRLVHSIRIAQKILNKSAKQEDRQRYSEVSRQTGKDEQAARVILKSFSSELRSEYLSCLKNFSSLISNSTSDSMQRGLLETLEDEIKRVEDHEHISDLIDTYEIKRISRELEYYIQEAAKSTTDVKSNGLIGSDGHRSGLRSAISMPRLPPERDASGGGMKKTSEKKSKEIIKASMPPRLPLERHTSGGVMKKTSEKKSRDIIKASMPPVRDTSGGAGGRHRSDLRRVISMPWLPPERDTSGGGMKKTSEKKSMEIIKATMPPVRDTSGGGGHRSGLQRVMLMPRLPLERHTSGGVMKKTSEKKSRDIKKASMPPVRDTSGGAGAGGRHRSDLRRVISMPWLPPERDTSGGGMKKTSEKKSKEIIKASMPPVRDTSGGGGYRSGLQRVMSMPWLPLERDTSGGGMKKTSEKKSRDIVKASMPPVRDTSGGAGGGGHHRSDLQRVISMPWLPPERDTSGGGMKKTNQKKSKEIIKLSMPPVRDTSAGGGLKKKSEAKSKEIIEVSQPEGDTSSGGGHGGGAGGMKKNSIVKMSKKIINVCFWLKLASMVSNSRERDHMVEFGRDFLRGSGAEENFSRFILAAEKESCKMDSEMVVHNGGCHCRSVRWRVQSPSSVVAWQCNCSDCLMRGNTHFIVPSERFELLGDSKQFITTYTFGTHTAKHTFCKVCGITSFYTPRSNPDGVSVTFRDKKRGGQGQAGAAHSACMTQQEGAAEAADEKMAKDLLFISP
ncbi:hypothetical protein C3L33_01827, partial [Rhododendron williamsianum]